MTQPPDITLRQYLLMDLLADGVDWSIAMEAIHSTAIEFPDWDLDEKRTWAEWDQWSRTT